MRFRVGSLGLAVFIAATSSSCGGSKPTAATNEPAHQTLNSDPVSPPDVQPEKVQGDEVSAEWVKSQVELNGALFVSIVDQKNWPTATDPSTTIVLGIARQKATGLLEKSFDRYFPFVLLARPSGKGTEPASLLGLSLSTDLYVVGGENRPLSIDVTPRQIREGEYVFGTIFLTGSVGNKGGMLDEMLSLYRYHDGELKEIFRDAVWAYGKYSDLEWRSCNVEMEILSQPSAGGAFFTLTRQYRRSYFGNARNPEFNSSNSNREQLAETPIMSCSLTSRLQAPHPQTWSTERQLYLDASGRFLKMDDFMSGWPWP